MPSAEENDPLNTTDHEASPRPAVPAVSADGRCRALADHAVTATHVPDSATGPPGTEPERGRGAISVPGYEIEALLGRGGMGVVYKARHLALKRTVALKMVLAGGHAGPSELARFRLEAEAVARLQHPNIVQIHEVGQADGHPYCALEFVEGGNLAKKIAGRPLPAPLATRLVEALARGMQLAHSRNVVHRDLKPANILLAGARDEGRGASEGGPSSLAPHPSPLIPKITDFGLARQLDSDSGETQAGAVMGTPSYMAPEQASGRAHEAGPAADIYALGAILYECLTGRPPFKGKTTVETLDQVRTQEPVPPSRRQAGVPLDLETICLKCLHKEPEKRYASAAELADDLVRYQHGEPIRARPVGGIERCVKWVKRNPVVTGAAAAVVLALAGGATYGYLKYRETEAALARESQRVTERDDALGKRNKALDESNYQLDRSNFLLAVAAYDLRDVAGARLRLDSIQAKHRGWEWHYLRRQATGAIFTVYGHTTSVAFSPDGTRIVTGSDKTVKVWDAETGTLLLELKGHTGSVHSVAFSPDGTRIVTGAGEFNMRGEAKVWDARTGTPQLELKGQTSYVTSVAFSPDGTRLVTGSYDRTAKVWDARTGTPQLELKGHTSTVFGVAFNPDGTRVVTGSWDTTAKVWDAQTGTLLLELKGHTSPVYSVAFSPDGRRIVTGSWDRTAKVWDAHTGTLQLELTGHKNYVYSVAFSPDGRRIVTGSLDRTAKLWDAYTGTPQLELKGHARSVYSVAFNKDGTRIVTGSADKTAKVWDARTGRPQLELKGHTSPVTSVVFNPDGTRIVTASEDQTAKVWDARTGTPQLELKGHTNMLKSVVFSPDGTRIVTASWDRTAKVWDAPTGTIQALKGHAGKVISVAFSPDGTRIVTGSEDRTARVWDARTHAPLLELKGHTTPVFYVAFSPDGTRIVTHSDEARSKVWDARTGQEVEQEVKGKPIPQTIPNHRINPDGRIFAHPDGDRVELIPLQPDAEELSYRRLHTQPNIGRYRDGYEAARAAQDNFAARFYLNLLPPAEQQILKAQAAADREIAAGRTPDALAHLVMVSASRPDDTSLPLQVAELQAWFGQDKELADTCERALKAARGTFDPKKWDQLARVCCLRPTPDTTRREAASALARKAVEAEAALALIHRALGMREQEFASKLTLGMAEYRRGHFAEADAALTAAADDAKNNRPLAGTASFYRAMSLFRQGNDKDARNLAREAAATMKPLPKDDKNPLAGDASADDLMLWLAYKEAKGLIQFDVPKRGPGCACWPR